MNPLDPNHLKATNPTSIEDRQAIFAKNVENEEPPNEGDLSSSPWAKMFPGGESATKEQLNMFIHLFIKDLVAQMKRDDAHFKESLARQRRMMEGTE